MQASLKTLENPSQEYYHEGKVPTIGSRAQQTRTNDDSTTKQTQHTKIITRNEQ